MNIKQRFNEYHNALATDFSTTALRTMIVIWALFVIVLVFFINNSWLLAGILLYEILP